MATRYDAFLGLVPTGLIGGGIAQLLGFDLSAFIAGGLFSLFIVFWALFIDPPSDPLLGPHQ